VNYFSLNSFFCFVKLGKILILFLRDQHAIVFFGLFLIVVLY